MLPSSHNFVIMSQRSFAVIIFQAHKSLFVYLFLLSRSACWGSRLALSQRPPGDAEGTRARWMNSPGVAVMSGGTSKAREARPDVLSHRIFSRPDQPPLQARHSYRNIKGHKCTHASADTHSSRVTTTRHTPAFSNRSWGPCICHHGPSFVTVPLTRSQSSERHVSLCQVHFSLERAASSS